MLPDGFDLLITANETNSHHGVGILLQRFFPDSSNFVCLRSSTLYNGETTFGTKHLELRSRYLSLYETEVQLRQILANHRIRRILCVPYYREDFIHAILAKRITGAPLCTYVMDDQNIFAPEVPDHWAADLLSASDLRLGISPELCAAYTKKFAHPVYLLPPLLGQAKPLVPCYWSAEPGMPLCAAMIGNVWTNRRFAQLRALLRASGLHLDWYGNGSQASWLEGTPEEWETDNIRCMGFLPEEDLVASLASYPFIVVPSGSLDEDDDNQAFSRLSLPSRLVFLNGHTDTPVLILGSAETAAARFVRQFGSGLCSAYAADALQDSLRQILDSTFRGAVRRRIRRQAQSLSFEKAGDWIWESLHSGKPVASSFAKVFDEVASGPAAWLDQVMPAQPRFLRPAPKIGAPFQDAEIESFRIVRRAHMPVLRASGLVLPNEDDLELSSLHGASAEFALQRALSRGGDVLVLGPAAPAYFENLPSTIRLWRVVDLGVWQRSGFAGDSQQIIGLADGAPYPEPFPQFDAIVSTGWCGQFGPDVHPLEGIALYLEACTKPGGFNLHFFSAVLHPAYFWIAPACSYLARRFLSPDHREILDEALSVEDVLFMSESAYDRFWKPSVQKSSVDFGRAFSASLFWRRT